MDRRKVRASRSAGAALATRLLPFAIIFFAIQFGVRLSLTLRVRSEAADSPLDFLTPFLIGTWFDLAVFSVFAVPVVIWWLAAPQNLKGGRLDRYATLTGATLFLVLCLFAAVAEHLFWTEFATRFNFIAVDYLIYTNEVIGNIWQSYPVAKALAALVRGRPGHCLSQPPISPHAPRPSVPGAEIGAGAGRPCAARAADRRHADLACLRRLQCLRQGAFAQRHLGVVSRLFQQRDRISPLLQDARRQGGRSSASTGC